MNQNQNKKTLRHFQCRDFLWEIFEQMSGELECSIDYLINEAMRQYARARNYSPRQGLTPSADAMPAATRTTRPVGPQPPMGPGGGAPRPPIPQRPGPPPPLPSTTRPQPPHPQQPGPPVQMGMPPQGATMPRPVAPAQPAQPFGAPPQPAQGEFPQGAARLFLIFNGRKLPINKEQFIIGRGTKTSDLPIKDGNISRKHAAVILHSGVYYLKDLGSTNGIEYNGMRIDNKRIEEGDVFHICDYELRFTYR